MATSSNGARQLRAFRLCRAGAAIFLGVCLAILLIDFYREARTERLLADIHRVGGLSMRKDDARSRPVIGIDLDAHVVYDTGEVRDRCRVTDGTLRLVARFDQLEVLSLDGADVTDVGLARLTRLKELRRLTLSRTRVTDRGLACLKELPALEFIDLRDTQVTPAGIRALEQALPMAEILASEPDGAEPVSLVPSGMNRSFGL